MFFKKQTFKLRCNFQNSKCIGELRCQRDPRPTNTKLTKSNSGIQKYWVPDDLRTKIEIFDKIVEAIF